MLDSVSGEDNPEDLISYYAYGKFEYVSEQNTYKVTIAQDWSDHEIITDLIRSYNITRDTIHESEFIVDVLFDNRLFDVIENQSSVKVGAKRYVPEQYEWIDDTNSLDLKWSVLVDIEHQHVCR
jgi:hypothetical protein